jgi:hypothetical protein
MSVFRPFHANVLYTICVKAFDALQMNYFQMKRTGKLTK